VSGAVLSRWLRPGRPGTSPQDTPAADPRTAVRRQQFAEAGELLFAHGLDPTTRNYAVARAFGDGQPAMRAAVAAILRDRGCLTEKDMVELASLDREGGAAFGDGTACDGAALETLAGQLAVQMDACVAAAGRFGPSARVLEVAIGGEVPRARLNPAAALERLAALTHELVETVRVTDEELGRARDEVGALRASLEDARQAAARDHLTGLPNRRGFEEAVARRGPGQGGWLALCDLDRFKQVNDEHGHDAGDRVLRFFAQRLAAAVGERALVARHGGEEFVCLFAGDAAEPVLAALDGLRQELEARGLVNRDTGRRIGPITFSGGLARIDGDPVAALRRADAALYRAKDGGRNRLVVAGD